MNDKFGNDGWGSVNFEWETFRNIADFAVIDPSAIYSILDVRYDSINKGAHYVEMTGFVPGRPANRSARLIDYPGNYHQQSGVISFVDGHVETHDWIDSRTTPPFGEGELTLNVASSGNSDVYWLQSHATVAK